MVKNNWQGYCIYENYCVPLPSVKPIETKFMYKRNHKLEVGEIVFDNENRLWGRVIRLNHKNAVIGQRDLIKRNKIEMDCEAEKDAEEWVVSRANLYQEAKGVTDRYGNSVCYEHLIGEYPFYSPSLDENMFAIEVTFNFEK